jgi:hypothetical protein
LKTAPVLPDEKGWYSLKRDVDLGAIEGMRELGHIAKLSITDIGLVTVRHVARLKALQSVGALWLWCDVTRRAMRHLIQLPGLLSLDVLCIQGPGELAHFEKAPALKVFRANHYMTEQDLLNVCRCESLQELGAQGCTLTHTALSGVLELPHLHSLDIEATRFDDNMARRLSGSRSITSLDIGATRVTREGLKHLTKMRGLRSLDLWATRLDEDDLTLLRDLPALEYLSLGNIEGCQSLDADRIVPLLLELPALERVWLDGMRLKVEHEAALKARLDSVRVS